MSVSPAIAQLLDRLTDPAGDLLADADRLTGELYAALGKLYRTGRSSKDDREDMFSAVIDLSETISALRDQMRP